MAAVFLFPLVLPVRFSEMTQIDQRKNPEKPRKSEINFSTITNLKTSKYMQISDSSNLPYANGWCWWCSYGRMVVAIFRKHT